MERKKIADIISNAEMDSDAKTDSIFAIFNGERNDAIKALNTMTEQYNQAKASIDSMSDYEAVKQERDTLLAEKGERDISDRFSAVSNGSKWKNNYTREGVFSEFKTALADGGNKGKTDDDIFKSVIGERSAELFDTAPQIHMEPSKGGKTSSSEKESLEDFLAEKYKNNPYYRRE